jgi:putative intracellular protease/amidase
MAPLQIGLVLFPKLTQLDLTGPLQVFSSVPGAVVHLLWKRSEPIPSDSVLTLLPTTTFADCPQLDVVCVPGGFGVDDVVDDEEVLAFLRRQAKGARYITSVCTGSLVLGAAGRSTVIALRPIGARATAWRRSAPFSRPSVSASIATGSPAAASPPESISR